MATLTSHEQKQIENLGKRIREIRKARGFDSHETFAYQKDIARSQYGLYEKGADLRFTSLLKVLNALDISLAEFFGEGFDDKK